MDTSKEHIKKIKQMQNKRFEYYDKQGLPIEKRMLIPKHTILYTANLIHLPELED